MINEEGLCTCGTQPIETERLLLKAFTFDDADSIEGTLREYFYRNGKYEDRMYFSILKKEF